MARSGYPGRVSDHPPGILAASRLQEAVPFDENKHPRGGKGSAAGGKFIAKGSSGGDVKRVQKKVGAKPDSKFGDKTEQAVRAYQKKNKLQVDGVVGTQTAAALTGNKKAAKVKVGALTEQDLRRLRKAS